MLFRPPGPSPAERGDVVSMSCRRYRASSPSSDSLAVGYVGTGIGRRGSDFFLWLPALASYAEYAARSGFSCQAPENGDHILTRLAEPCGRAACAALRRRRLSCPHRRHRTGFREWQGLSTANRWSPNGRRRWEPVAGGDRQAGWNGNPGTIRHPSTDGLRRRSALSPAHRAGGGDTTTASGAAINSVI